MFSKNIRDPSKSILHRLYNITASRKSTEEMVRQLGGESGIPQILTKTQKKKQAKIKKKEASSQRAKEDLKEGGAQQDKAELS
jgi:hypothetical protein